ncbi:MAG TPA: ABC transporter ATP-binding protein [Acidimicrobiales bacterium]|jgi:iron(III) transport system ATP-binding protein|nr:ABC transporter ATP-binding protein [Acidimicrobiales bacterium]
MTDLTISGVHKAFGDHPVLGGIDLAVPAATCTAILGPSGSGKTTLLRILAGFERADAGEVRIAGELVEGPSTHMRPEDRRIGYVPQEGALFPHLRVAANIAFGLKDRKVKKQRVAEMLDLIGMSDLGGRYPHELSGGQQQRVALARALAARPALVLLDEPFSSLDAALRSSMRMEVQRLLRETGTTTILVTHDQDEALSTSDLVAVVEQGRIVQHGSPLEVYSHPATAGVAAFVGQANVLAGVVRGGRVETALGQHLLPGAAAPSGDGDSVSVMLRPEQLEIAERGGAPGTVTAVDFHGHDTLLTVALEGGESLRVRLQGPNHLVRGARIALTGPADGVTVWPAGERPSVEASADRA